MSVIIACYDRVDGLRRAVAALEKQTFTSFELIAVDQTGRSELRDIIESAQIPARYVRCPIDGPPHRGRPPSNASHARNVGVLEAEAQIVAFTDDDCEPDPAWIERISEPLRNNPKAVLVAGASGPLHASSEPAESEHTDRRHPVLFRSMGGSCSLALRKDAFCELGGFDTAIGPGTAVAGSEDSHLVYRALRYAEDNGSTVVGRRDATVIDAPLNRRDRLRRSLRYMPCFGMYLRREYLDNNDNKARETYRMHVRAHWRAIGTAARKRKPYWTVHALIVGILIMVGWHRRRLPRFEPELDSRSESSELV